MRENGIQRLHLVTRCEGVRVARRKLRVLLPEPKAVFPNCDRRRNAPTRYCPRSRVVRLSLRRPAVAGRIARARHRAPSSFAIGRGSRVTSRTALPFSRATGSSNRWNRVPRYALIVTCTNPRQVGRGTRIAPRSEPWTIPRQPLGDSLTIRHQSAGLYTTDNTVSSAEWSRGWGPAVQPPPRLGILPAVQPLPVRGKGRIASHRPRVPGRRAVNGRVHGRSPAEAAR